MWTMDRKLHDTIVIVFYTWHITLQTNFCVFLVFMVNMSFDSQQQTTTTFCDVDDSLTKCLILQKFSIPSCKIIHVWVKDIGNTDCHQITKYQMYNVHIAHQLPYCNVSSIILNSFSIKFLGADGWESLKCYLSTDKCRIEMWTYIMWWSYTLQSALAFVVHVLQFDPHFNKPVETGSWRCSLF